MEILIPSTFTAEERNLLIRTHKIGLIARAAAIFGIKKIWIYYDEDPLFNSIWLGELIEDVLKYAVLPPHLKKYFPIKERMRYVGVVPPLQIPSHPSKDENPEFITGRVIRSSKGKSFIDIGKTSLIVNKNLKKGEFVDLKVDWNKKIANVIERDQIPFYWGYDVFFYKQKLNVLVKELKNKGYFLIGTSKYGEPLDKVEEKLKIGLKNDKTAVIFGSAYRGLFDILDDESRRYVDLIINTVKMQKTKTIRTEESVFITLALLNNLI
jgi:predicted SPOUT superfamily RNA methylase MTH1